MSPEDFKAGMRKFPGAVSVITAAFDGVRAGMTATAVMSLTAEPPQLAVALNRQASALPSVLGAKRFAINALAYDQDRIGDRFAGAGGIKGAARFEGADWTTLVTGAPILQRAAVSFDCELRTLYEIDTHVILIGSVKAVQLGEGDRQLLYVGGAWAGLVQTTSDDLGRYNGAVMQALSCIEEAKAQHGGAKEQLRHFVHAFAEFHMDLDQDLERLLALEPYLKQDDLARIKAHKKAFDHNLEALLSDGVAAGEFRIANVPLIAQMIVGMTSWPGRWRKSTGVSREELGDKLWELVDVVVGAGCPKSEAAR